MNGYPPLPASPMLLSHVLGLVFILHILFMNYVVAAPLISAWYLIVKGERGRRRARWMLGTLPVAFTFAINFGVAALLFVQALFAESFFTANIILGTGWLSIIGLLLAAFSGAYIAKHLAGKAKRSPRWSGLLGLLLTLLVWAVGIAMVSNYFISTKQDSWLAFRAVPSAVLGTTSFLPRALHFLIGSFAVTGFWMMWISWWRSRRGDNHADVLKFFRQGAAVATAATSIQIVVGIWFVLSLSPSVWDHLFSGTFPSIVWISGVAAGLLLLASLMATNFAKRRFFWLCISSGLLFYTLVGMVAGRDVVRLAAFGDAFKIREIPFQPQVQAMQVFLILLILGLVALGYLFWLLWKQPPVPAYDEE